MNLTDLGRRAVTCKHWRWMPGMAWIRLPSGAPDDGGDIGRIDDLDADRAERADERERFIPDLSDPATLGCLLHLVREAWSDPDLSADRVSRAHDKLPDVWQVYVFYESGVKDVLSGHSEVEALVAALGAAP